MKNFVINQLLPAVIMIVTTIITVRYTQLGSFGISQRFKDKLRAKLTRMSAIIFGVVIPALIVLFTGLGIRRLVVADGPPSRYDVFNIAFYTVVATFWLGETSKGLANIINMYRGGKNQD